MKLRTDGYEFWREGHALAMLIITDKVDDINTYASYNNPTDTEIVVACQEHDINPGPILKAVREKDPGCHTLFIDVPTLKAASKEE